MNDEGKIGVAVAPEDHPWREGICNAVARGGGCVVALDEADALIWMAKGDAVLSDHLRPQMRWVQFRSAGVEHWIERGEIDEGRTFTSTRGAYARAVAEHAVALLLAASRRIHDAARVSRWEGSVLAGRLLAGSTVGIVGAGGVGQELVDLLQAFQVRIVAVTRSGRSIPGADESLSATKLRAVLSDVDYLVVSAPATVMTTAMVGGAELEALPDHAWIINVARGSLIDTDALVDALANGTLGGAALDVTDPEPLPEDHPLWQLDNVLITPHVANPKSAQRPRLEAFIEENVHRFVTGRPLMGVVDLEIGY